MDRTPPTAFAFSSKARRTGSPPITYLMAEGVTNANLISLAAGLIDYESLPVRRLAGIAARLLGDEAAGRAALQYGTTEGLAELREAVLARLERAEGRSRKELGLTPRNVVITSGSQQMLYLLTDALVDPGDIVIAAAPSYFVYASVLHSIGAEVLTVPADRGGMRTDALADLLERIRRAGRLDRVKIIYVVSYFDNPTGVSIEPSRRPELVELARRYSADHRILVIEDAAYRELQYDGAPTPSVKSFDAENRFVALTMTFSKSFAAGMKTGFAFLPDELVDPVLDQKGTHDFGSANLLQHLLRDVLASGEYDRHLAEVRGAYRRKRDVMLAALDRELGASPGVSWTRPEGGLYVWLTLPEDVDTGRGGELFSRCLAAGVLYVPGEFCYARSADRAALPELAAAPVPRNHLRLSFGVASPAAIEEGVRRLGACIRSVLGSRDRSGSGRAPHPMPGAAARG